MSHDGWGGQASRRWVSLVLAEHGTTCHLCGHAGSDTGDHIKPRSTHPHLQYDVANGRPAHHKPCPTCGVRCNIKRKNKRLTVTPSVDALAFFDTTTG